MLETSRPGQLYKSEKTTTPKGGGFYFKIKHMFTAQSGMLTMLFNENGINSNGSLTTSLRKPPEMSFQREQATQDIEQMAKDQNVPVGVIISKIISQSIPELQSFVQARGESPADDPKKLAIQAALLRATEIGMVSKMQDVDDSNALYQIEESEQQHVEDNTGETSSILSPSTSAAIFLLVQRIKQRRQKTGKSDALKKFANDMKVTAGVNNFNNVCCGALANNADGDEYLLEYEDNYGPVGSSSSWWENLFGNIDKVTDAITKAAGAVNTTVGNVKNTTGNILDQINNVGGGIGAASIEQYLAKNGLKLAIIIIVIVLIIILIVRAAKR